MASGGSGGRGGRGGGGRAGGVARDNRRFLYGSRTRITATQKSQRRALEKRAARRAGTTVKGLRSRVRQAGIL